MVDPSDELVSVLVPKRYVLKIYAYLAQFDAVGADDSEDQGDNSPLPGGTVGAVTGGKVVPWTFEDLQRLAASTNPTTMLVSRMLDVLAARRSDWIGTTELVGLLGVEKTKLRGTLAALTRHVKAHYGRLNWPMKFEWNGTEATYKINPDVAELWPSVRES